jgi:hypothetical protein
MTCRRFGPINNDEHRIGCQNDYVEKRRQTANGRCNRQQSSQQNGVNQEAENDPLRLADASTREVIMNRLRDGVPSRKDGCLLYCLVQRTSPCVMSCCVASRSAVRKGRSVIINSARPARRVSMATCVTRV